MKSKIQMALLGFGMIVAFTASRTLAAECSYHQPTCTYRVSGCMEVQALCNEHGGGKCYQEYGICCPGGGTDYSTFCAPSCDGSGGGPPCAN
jgi:hypothetical protein